LFTRVHVLAMPTMPDEAPDVLADLPGTLRVGPAPALGSLAGLPGVSVPMGFGPSGLPLGLSLTADFDADRLVLHVADLFQRATNWHEMTPATK